MLTILSFAAIALIVVLGKDIFAPRTKLQPIKIKQTQKAPSKEYMRKDSSRDYR